jgi:hypothetical protein
VAKHAGERKWDGAIVDVEIGVADTAGSDGHQDLPGAGLGVAQGLDAERTRALANDGGPHRWEPR